MATKVKDKKPLETPDGKTNVIPTKMDEQDMKDMLTFYKSEIDEAIDARLNYVNRQLKWFKKRYGIRSKAVYPWPGASNLHLPLQDKTVRKRKPDYVNVIMNPLPMVQMTNYGGADEKEMNDLSNKAAWHFDWLLRERMNIFPDVVVTADITLSKGFSLVKVIYEIKYEPVMTRVYRKVIEEKTPELLDIDRKEELVTEIANILEITDSSLETDVERCSLAADALILGDEYVDIISMLVVYDAPRIIPKSPWEIVVPRDTVSIFDLEDARWYDDPNYYTAGDLIAGSEGKDAKWDRKVVEEILGKEGITIEGWKAWNHVKERLAARKTDTEKSSIDLQADLREGIFGIDDATFMVHEMGIWEDRDGDGIKERHVLEFCDTYLEAPLRFHRYQYKLNTWPVFKVPYEIVDYRHYGPRGLIEILDPIATSLNIQHNQMVNSNTIQNSLNYWYVPDKVNEENIDFTFNRGIPVSGGDAIGMLQTKMGTQPDYLNTSQMLKAWAEEMIASGDSMNTSVMNPSGGRKGDTKYELEMMSSQAAPVMGLDLGIWLQAWKRIFEAVWSLWNQYGPLDEIGFKMRDKMIRMTRDELTGKYNVGPNGRVGAEDPVLEAQKAKARLSAFAGDIYMDQWELRYDYLMKDDPRLVARFLRPKEVVGELLAAQAAIAGGNDANNDKGDQKITGGGPSKPPKAAQSPGAK